MVVFLGCYLFIRMSKRTRSISDTKDRRDSKDSKGSKDSKDSKHSKDSKDATSKDDLKFIERDC